MFNKFLNFWDYCVYTALISPFFSAQILQFWLRSVFVLDYIVYFCKIDVFWKFGAAYD